MNAMDASYRSSFPHGDLALLDAVSLHLSANGALDEFDFHLVDDDPRPESRAGRHFADSPDLADLGALLSSVSQGSLSTNSLMDLEVDDSLKSSFGAACSIQDDRGDPPGPGHRSSDRSARSAKRCRRRQTRERHEGPPGPGNPHFQMRAVNFDPPSAEQERSRQLDRLAASMKRTEASRRCVLLQRELLFTPEQLQQIRDAKEELQRQLGAAMQLCQAQRADAGLQQPPADAASSAELRPPAPGRYPEAVPACSARLTPRPFHDGRAVPDARATLSHPGDMASFLAASRGAMCQHMEQGLWQRGVYMATE